MRQPTTPEWTLLGLLVLCFYVCLILSSVVRNNPCSDYKCVKGELVLLIGTDNGERNWVNTHEECP